MIYCIYNFSCIILHGIKLHHVFFLFFPLLNELKNLSPITQRTPPNPLYSFSSPTLVYSKKKRLITTKSTEYPKWQWTKYLFKLFDSHTDTHTHMCTVSCNCVYLAKRADAWACVIVDIRTHTHAHTQRRQTGLKNVEIMKMTVKSTKRSARRQRGE